MFKVGGFVEDRGPITHVIVQPCSPDVPQGQEGEGKSIRMEALIDTGMGIAMITRGVADALGVSTVQKITFGGASFFGGMRELDTVCLLISFGPHRTWRVLAGVVEDLGLAGVDLALGQMFLQHFRFTQFGPAKQFTLEW